MSLLLSGAKTMTFAGTEMQCLEIYTGEAYTIDLQFTDSSGNAANANGWTLGTTAKFYNVSGLTYGEFGDTVNIGNIALYDPVPNANAYSNLTAAFANADAGTGYLYIPPEIADGSGVGNTTPVPPLNDGKASPESILVIVTLEVERPNATSSQVDIQKTPLGFVVRYQ